MNRSNLVVIFGGADAEAAEARLELSKERADKQAIIDRLVVDTARIAQSPDWKISHVTFASYDEAVGIQESPYEKKRKASYSTDHYQSIKWTLSYRGVCVWKWEDGLWRPVELSVKDLVELGIPLEQVSGKCLEQHKASEYAAMDPVVTVKVTSTLVEPKLWSEGSPCGYPLHVTLIGRSYDYHYLAQQEDSQVEFLNLEGADTWGQD